MSTGVVLAVLLGALLHAAWNALVKSSGDKQLDIALVHCLGALVALPLLVAVGLPPAASLPFLAASLCIHVAYYVTLNGASARRSGNHVSDHARQRAVRSSMRLSF